MLLAMTAALQTNFTDAFPFIAAALLISVFVTALMYMVGNLLQSQEVLGMGKDSLANVVFTAIIVLMFAGLFGIFSSVAGAVACDGSCDHLQAAYWSILLLRAKLSSLYFNLYFYELVFGFFSTLGFSIPLSALNPATLGMFIISMPSVHFAPLSGLTPLSNAHTVVVEAVGTALLMVFARQVLLEFIMNYMHIFLVLGAAMRSFIFTRRTGSSILALAAVAYFVYPVAVMGTNYLIFQQYQASNFGIVPTAMGYCSDPQAMAKIAQDYSTKNTKIYEADTEVSTSAWYSFWGNLRGTIKFVATTVDGMLKTLGSFNTPQIAATVLSPVMFTTFFDFVIMEIQTDVQFLVLVFVSFFMEIIVTITMYRAAASLIDGEAEIFGISKLM